MPGFRRLFARALACGVAGLLTAACGHMPVTSMVKLAQVDFTATDLSGLRAAVKLPLAIRPLRDEVRLRLTVRLASGNRTQRNEIGPGTHIFAYRLEPAETMRLAAFRDALKKQQAASGGRGGALTIAIAPQACRSGELPAGAVLFTTYLRTAETGGYVALARDVDMRSVVRGRDVAAQMPICG